MPQTKRISLHLFCIDFEASYPAATSGHLWTSALCVVVVGGLNYGDFSWSLLLGLLFKNHLKLAQIPMQQHLIREGLHPLAVG